MKVAIVDYGLGNLRSVSGAVSKLGYLPFETHDKEEILSADKLILPGVGAFGDGMKNLHSLGLIECLNQSVLEKKTPILGICLGSQLMAKISYEFGKHEGLGWINASVKKLNSGTNLRIPHVGWNGIVLIKEDPLFTGILSNELFYFVHSFHVCCEEKQAIVAECEYGIQFTAAFHKDNIFGTQFHPEKSQSIGLKLLNNFLSLC
ncbi:MAG: imidazole glycerol phosphate synthase subunit HisH [Candidatus Omnitrophica bacterium]|jgi:glutamine amidotransferase|nr:imidazole glycerol phosphate synthase subunit HisH [Candidatus Omnitrophota bacterium]MDD5660336.1 imidazole glycerol phosphate synthase subunit HisH [Candidatus Omnitrophota bacterium]